jgi:protein tyrosine/serine phosphatase
MRGITAKSFALLLVAVAVCAQTTLPQSNTKQKDLPNFRRVADGLYRGGQPTEVGLQELVQLKIKTVVNLRDNDDRARAEETAAVAAGLRYFNLPLSNFHKPGNERVAEILSIINAPANQPVFVHCKRGADRTGVIIAIYRIERDGWTSEQAKKEAEQFGLGFWQIRMKDYISDYYEHKVAKSESTLPAPTPKHR